MNRKPLILHLCPSVAPLGGIWTYIRHILESRLADSYQFRVCFYPEASVGVSLSIVLALRRSVRECTPDLVHLHGLQTEGFHCMMAALLGSRAPRLLTVHGYIEDSRFRTPWRRAAIARILEPVTILTASAAFAVSKYGSNKVVLRKWARRLFGCIDNAIPYSVATLPTSASNMRTDYGWSSDDVVAICVARLSREKGLLDLVDAVAAIHKEHPKVRVLLVGSGPDSSLVQKRILERGVEDSLVIHSETEAISPLLAASDVFVLPSFHENQSFAILEAMMAGLPVISTNVGGTPELVHHGVSGILIPPGQPIALGEALKLLAGDPNMRIRYGQAGQIRVGKKHCFNNFIDQVDNVYREMIDGNLEHRKSKSIRS